ncbi:MAG: cellobiose phosphorylase, partial [Anaerolineaceae bacterium]|nr:cellobiose phosphorylase [Anaerolineaceae bacterium]
MGIQFLNDDADFTIIKPENISGLYFPLASEAGLKSAITPNLGGDCKLDQESFLLEPVSIENLHNNRSSRNFWCAAEDGCWSAAGVSALQEADKFTQKQDESSLTAGLMWQTAVRESAAYGLRAEITSFVPKDETAEVMAVRISNAGISPISFTPIAAVPIYGRSADNLRDHRNVTSMLHRIRTTENGILVTPTMSFDEKGHRHNSRTYYIFGHDGEGRLPVSFYPTTEMFIGEGGSFLRPRSVFELRNGVPSGTFIEGKEAMGGIRFQAVTLEPG